MLSILSLLSLSSIALATPLPGLLDLSGTAPRVGNILADLTINLSDGVCAFVDITNPFNVKVLGDTLTSLKSTQICACALNSKTILQANIKTNAPPNSKLSCKNGGVVIGCNSGFQLLNGLCVKVPVCNNGKVNVVDNVLRCVCDIAHELLGGTTCSPICGENSIRQGSKCLCKEGFRLANGICLPAPLSCPVNQKVSLVGGIFKCVCNSGFKLLNDVCVAAPRCLTGETLKPIDGEYKCLCASAFESINGVCVKKCSTNQIRNGSGVCECKAGSILDATLKCIVCPVLSTVVDGACKCNSGLSLIGGKCVKTPVCTGGQTLVNGKCACDIGLSLNNLNVCVKLPVCDLNALPILNGLTNLFECRCNAGHSLLGGKCVKNPSCPEGAILSITNGAFGCQCKSGLIVKVGGICLLNVDLNL